MVSDINMVILKKAEIRVVNRNVENLVKDDELYEIML